MDQVDRGWKSQESWYRIFHAAKKWRKLAKTPGFVNHVPFGFLYDAGVNNSSSTTAGAWSFRILFAGSILTALLVWSGPGQQMPLDYRFIWSWGLGLSALWLVVVIVSAFFFRKKALWLLIGAPLVLYWPIWLALNGLPSCYWHRNCA